MDLSTLEKMVKDKRFRSRVEFLQQVDLIVSNCIAFNGVDSPLTTVARAVSAAGSARLQQDADTLDTIESSIQRWVVVVVVSVLDAWGEERAVLCAR